MSNQALAISSWPTRMRTHRAPLLGASLIVLLMSAFAAVLDAVQDGGSTARLDRSVLISLTSHRQPTLTHLMSAISWITAPVQVSVLTVLIAAWLRWRLRAPLLPLAAIVALVGSGATTYSIKQLVGRARPVAPYALTPDNEPSFPSGHTLTATLMTGLLVYVLVRHLSSRWARTAVVALGVTFVAGVAISRLYLGAHWLTDIVASVDLGLAWLVAVISAVAAGGASILRTAGRRIRPSSKALR